MSTRKNVEITRSYDDGDGPITMWGHAQQVTEMVYGILFVSTACHGGVLIPKKLALKKLSKHARSVGCLFNGYYSYDEDCEWAIPFIENPYWATLCKIPKKALKCESWDPKSCKNVKEQNTDLIIEFMNAAGMNVI